MILALAISVGTAGCGKNQEPPPPSSGSPNAQPESAPKRDPGDHAMGGAMDPGTPTGAPDPQRAQKMYGMVCAMCHGVDGTGTGAAAKDLNPKPRNYTDPKWQASVTDDELKKIILLGGAGVGKSPMMPGQPQLKDQPEVLDGLVKIIRGFARTGEPSTGSSAPPAGSGKPTDGSGAINK